MNALLWHARGWPATERPSLVGRLDKLTSGIVVVAKSAAVHAALQRTMASSQCEKDYLAVVYGRVNVARGRDRLAARPRSGRPPEGRRVGPGISVGRAEPHLVRADRAGGRAARRACRSSAAVWRRAARIRSASTWRRAAGRSSATRRTASRDGPRSSTPRSPRRCPHLSGRRSTRGASPSPIPSRATG